MLINTHPSRGAALDGLFQRLSRLWLAGRG
jgi:hypothetical protein